MRTGLGWLNNVAAPRSKAFTRTHTGNNRIRWKHKAHWKLKYIYIYIYICIYIYIYKYIYLYTYISEFSGNKNRTTEIKVHWTKTMCILIINIYKVGSLMFKNVNAGCRFDIQCNWIPIFCSIDFDKNCSNIGVASKNMYILIMPSEMIMYKLICDKIIKEYRR